jgi:hypothetical protein
MIPTKRRLYYLFMKIFFTICFNHKDYMAICYAAENICLNKLILLLAWS